MKKYIYAAAFILAITATGASAADNEIYDDTGNNNYAPMSGISNGDYNQILNDDVTAEDYDGYSQLINNAIYIDENEVSITDI